jgi:hypothetical protein
MYEDICITVIHYSEFCVWCKDKNIDMFTHGNPVHFKIFISPIGETHSESSIHCQTCAKVVATVLAKGKIHEFVTFQVWW